MFDLIERYVPPELAKAIYGLASLFFFSWVGRMAFHVQQVQRQRRKFWSLHLVWETAVAVAIAFVADGIASYLGFTGPVKSGAVVAIAYIGPRGITTIVIWLADRHLPKAQG
ncbi:MAG: phage holin family protein [Alphaproteobacteria bacterium]